jgi:hypothetical protein
MAEMLADCPRCGGANITFDVYHSQEVGQDYRRKLVIEAYCTCRHCKKGTIFMVVAKYSGHPYDDVYAKGVQAHGGSINRLVEVERYISLRDKAGIDPPEHLPADINAAFKEGAACAAIACYNAAAAMYRLCVDHATWALLPEEGAAEPSNRVRRSLGLRLQWLFANGHLPPALQELSEAIKEDGNDGAHEGTLTKAEAEDLQDFTAALLERLYTEPERLRLAKERRDARRAHGDGA